MSRITLVAAVIGLLVILPSFMQTRQQKAAPPDFAGTMKKAVAAYENQKYGLCIRQLAIATQVVAEARKKILLAAMPPAPEGFERLPERKVSAQERAMMAGLTHTMVGQAMECKYRRKDRKGHINVNIMTDSPLIKMLAMQFSMAKMNPDLEEIGYNTHKGLLQKKGKSLELSILIAGKHLIQVKAAGITEDALFRMFNQAFVDKIAAQL